MQRERFDSLSGLPGAGTEAQQHGNAAALHELSREGDNRLSRVPGGEEVGGGEIELTVCDEGPCFCAGTGKAILKWLGPGHFEVI